MNLHTDSDNRVISAFLKDGYIVHPSEDLDALNKIRNYIIQLTVEYLQLDVSNSSENLLDNIADFITPNDLNGLRLHIMSGLASTNWFRSAFFSIARRLIESIVGNELVMQRNMGFSIMLPGDESSVIHLHSDSWGSECSPFEVVLWVPFVDCFKTKGIFLCPPEKDAFWIDKLHKFAGQGVEKIYKAVESDLVWPEIPYGRVLLFSPTLMHGGRVNAENSSRWSINLRFKSLFSPYAGKRLGEYFDPITIRAVSRLGLNFKCPKGFEE